MLIDADGRLWLCNHNAFCLTSFRYSWQMRPPSTLLVLLCTIILGRLSSYAQGQPSAQSVSVPMSLEGNAPIVTLTFRRPDGSVRTARFIFDSGGGAIILNEGLATEIALKPEGSGISEEGQQYRAMDVPAASIGGMPLDMGTSKAFMHLGLASFTNRDSVEGLLPGKALERYQVVLDYPRRQLSVGAPGSIPHRGEKLPCLYIASSGHPRVDVEIGGASYGFLLDKEPSSRSCEKT